MSTDLPISEDVFRLIVALRRDLHRRPELSWQESSTSARVRQEAAALGLNLLSVSPRGYGVVAELAGREPGPAVVLRADLDALPISEETGLPFSSEVPGVMHACGHDGHTSMILGAAAILSKQAPPPLPVRFLWQPAEERGEGAAAMIAGGALENAGMIFGGHLDRHYAPGQLCIAEGPVNACTDHFAIDIHGQTGHGARPHEALDAVVIGSLLVTALQTIVSREINPAHPSVISIGKFRAGTAHNVIAGHARLEGTIRAQHAEVRERLHGSLRRIAHAIADLHQARITVSLTPGTPLLINQGPAIGVARAAARALPEAELVSTLDSANMGGEDFSQYLERVPGCYIRIGAQKTGCESYPAHSSQFDFDERALAFGAAWFAKVALEAGEHLAAGENG